MTVQTYSTRPTRQEKQRREQEEALRLQAVDDRRAKRKIIIVKKETK